MKSILITKNDAEVTSLKQFCDSASYELIAQSFIDFEPVKSEFPQQYDWIFFGSKRSVDFFLNQHSLLSSSKVACIGPTTAAHLLARNIQPDFVGQFASDATEVAISLRQIIHNQSLVIPISSKSEHSISRVFQSNSCKEVVVYQTTLKSIPLSVQPNVLIFTSPSNVEGFLLSNSIAASSAIIAWGKTTQKYLSSQGYTNVSVLKTASLKEIPFVLNQLTI